MLAPCRCIVLHWPSTNQLALRHSPLSAFGCPCRMHAHHERRANLVTTTRPWHGMVRRVCMPSRAHAAHLPSLPRMARYPVRLSPHPPPPPPPPRRTHPSLNAALPTAHAQRRSARARLRPHPTARPPLPWCCVRCLVFVVPHASYCETAPSAPECPCPSPLHTLTQSPPAAPSAHDVRANSRVAWHMATRHGSAPRSLSQPHAQACRIRPSQLTSSTELVVWPLRSTVSWRAALKPAGAVAFLVETPPTARR